MSRYLHNLITKGENQHLDFKFEISDAKKIARTFSAFANTSGGKLLIGVKDNGNIAGIRSDEESYMAETAAHIYCKPRVEYTVREHRVGEKTVLEIRIPESITKPHLAPWKDNDWKAFIRMGDQNFLANRVITEYWKIKAEKLNVKLRYDDFEVKLFALLKAESEITLTRFVKSSRVPPSVATKILAQLISVGVIDFRVTEDETYFCLNDQ